MNWKFRIKCRLVTSFSPTGDYYKRSGSNSVFKRHSIRFLFWSFLTQNSIVFVISFLRWRHWCLLWCHAKPKPPIGTCLNISMKIFSIWTARHLCLISKLVCAMDYGPCCLMCLQMDVGSTFARPSGAKPIQSPISENCWTTTSRLLQYLKSSTICHCCRHQK